ncbi:MAG: diguanylate cyclase [bacterium]|nr:diguanylate cyclase [bacterium]
MVLRAGEIINKRYEIIRTLGEGGMATVYQALDRTTQKEVALKFLKQNRISSFLEDKIRFRKEVEVVSKFNHAHIVRIFETGEQDNIPFIVLELLHGDSLYDLLKTNRDFSLQESVSIIKQTAEVLEYVHNKNVIHRDLKPGNIFLEKKTNKVMLLDFGLALLMELREIRETDEIIGTFGYMSPEATGIINKPVDERSDLYSLGIIFYRLMTGILPFTGQDISEILHKQVAVLPVRPGKLNPTLPKIIEDIIIKLLEKEPELRYQSAIGLLHDLNRFGKGEDKFIIGEMDQKIRLTYRSRLIGREHEFNRLRELLDQAGSSAGSVCFISGEAGIGKSRLMDELRTYIYEQAGTFFLGRCFSQENKIPFQPFRDIIDEYIRRIKKEGEIRKEKERIRIKTAFGKLSGMVIRFNANMKDILGDVEEVAPLDDPEKENKRFLMEYVRFLNLLCSECKSLVLLIDDIQWADEGSLKLVEELLKRISRSNLLLIATYRDNETENNHTIHSIRNDAGLMKYPLEEIKLSLFNYERLRKLTAEVLGEQEEKAEEIARFLMEKTKGNPFFVLTLLRELVERKAFVWNQGSWQADWNKVKELPVTSNIVDMILFSVKDLPEKEGQLLTISAVIGKEFELDLLSDLMKEPQENLITIIDSAVEKQLLEKSQKKGMVMFVHDRIKDAFYARMAPAERSRFHLMIARTIESKNKDRKDEFIYELAHHYLEAGTPDKSLEYSFMAAEKAKANYANDESIYYYRMVLKILEKEKGRSDPREILVREGLIDVYLSAGKNDEAIQLCQDILPVKKNKLEKARIYYKIGAAYQKKGNWPESEKALAQALLLLNKKLPRTRGILILALFKEFVIHVFHSLFSGIYMNKKIKNIKPEHREIIAVCTVLDWMYILTDVPKFLYTVLRSLNLAQAHIGRSRELGTMLASYSALCMAIPLFKRSYQYHKKTLEIKNELKNEQETAQTLQFIGYYHQWKGEYKESLDYFGQAIEKYRKIGDIWNLGMTLQGKGISLIYRGELKEALESLQEYLKISEETKDDFGITSCLGYMTEAYIEQGDLDAAEKSLARGYSLSIKQTLPFPLLGMYLGLSLLNMEKELWDKAIEFCEKARELNEKNQFLETYTTNIYFTLADACIESIKNQRVPDRNKLKKIRPFIRTAMKLGKKWVTHLPSSMRVHGKYLALLRKWKQAEKYFLAGISLAEKLERRFELAKCCFEYARFLEKRNKIERAFFYFQKAYKLFEIMDSHEYMKRCGDKLGLDIKIKLTRETPKERLQIEREMTTILETSRYFSSILLLDELLERITDKAIQLVGAERAILLLYPEENREDKNLEVKIARNLKETEIDTETFHASKKIISKVEVERKPLVIENAAVDEVWKDEESILRYGIKSMLCLPIMGKEDMLGIIYLDNRLVSGLFTIEDLKVLEIIFRQAGISIENAILYKKAISDGLTGLYNHSFFENYLMKSVNSSNRYNGKLGLLMLDIDNFKSFNDTYGHRAGDLILKTISDIIIKTIRRSDVASRYGGEEFSIILPETNLIGARKLAEKLRKMVERNKVQYRSNGQEIELKITVSIGCADLLKGEEWTDFVVRTDKALYKAKDSGRNRVEG